MCIRDRAGAASGCGQSPIAGVSADAVWPPGPVARTTAEYRPHPLTLTTKPIGWTVSAAGTIAEPLAASTISTLQSLTGPPAPGV